MNVLNKNGATSVLIIMLMVVLMVFGLTILTTTLSNQSLSEKKQMWLVDYYTLEGEVALRLADIDHQIQSIKEETVKEMTKDRLEIFKNKLSKLELDEDFSISFDVTEENDDYNKYIEVKLMLNMPDNNYTDEEFLMFSNYEIVKHSEVQDLFEYEDIKFGDPFAPDGE